MQGISWQWLSVHIVDPALYSVGKFVAATFHEFITWITQTCPYLSIWAVQYNFIDKFRIVFVNIVSMFKLIHWSFLLTLCLCFSLLYHDNFVFYYYLWCDYYFYAHSDRFYLTCTHLCDIISNFVWILCCFWIHLVWCMWHSHGVVCCFDESLIHGWRRLIFSFIFAFILIISTQLFSVWNSW